MTEERVTQQQAREAFEAKFMHYLSDGHSHTLARFIEQHPDPQPAPEHDEPIRPAFTKGWRDGAFVDCELYTRAQLLAFGLQQRKKGATPPEDGLWRALLALADEWDAARTSLLGDFVRSICAQGLRSLLRDFARRSRTLAAPGTTSGGDGSCGEGERQSCGRG
jgi:hypothetical protein